jgi:hypothetical protein
VTRKLSGCFVRFRAPLSTGIAPTGDPVEIVVWGAEK